MPHQFWRYRFQRFRNSNFEHELRLVPLLCDANKTSLDVGAAAGVYSANMVDASRDVIAFEPQPRQFAELREMFASVGAPVRVENVALSDQQGTLEMRMLVKDKGRSTIETENLLQDEDESPQKIIQVKVRRLDDYDLDAVGFIKIDVEGHELTALHGARETIARNQPILLIESEDRHRANAVSDITEFLQGMGYAGLFLLDGQPHDIAEFDVKEHQNSDNIGSWRTGYERRGIYINNFLFVPQERSEQLVESVSSLAATADL